MEKSVDIKKVLGGTALIALFLFKEAIAWILGEALSVLPIPRDEEGYMVMSEIPWGDLLAWPVLAVGIAFVVWGIIGKRRSHRNGANGEKKIGQAATQSDGGLAQEQIAALVDSRLEEFLATKLRAEFVTNRQSHAYDVKLAELSDNLKFVRGLAEAAPFANETDVKAIQDRVGEIAKGCHDLEHKFNDWSRDHSRDVEARFESVDVGFAAVQNRERHQRMFDELQRHYDEIEQPIISGQGLEDGGIWLKSVKHWQNNLDQWLVVAEYYAMGVSEKVKAIPDYVYERPWTFDEEPLTATQVNRYKQIATWWHNAQEQKRRVDKQFEYAAFHAPSKRPKNGSPPRPSEDQ